MHIFGRMLKLGGGVKGRISDFSHNFFGGGGGGLGVLIFRFLQHCFGGGVFTWIEIKILISYFWGVVSIQNPNPDFR